MGIAVICTGTELLRGTTVNTNCAYLGRNLLSAGLELSLQLSVGDRAGELVAALGSALQFADNIIVSGGLGPTDDDITLECCARFFGEELFLCEELRQKVIDCWQKYHRDNSRCPKKQFKQAMLPQNGHIIPNPAGSASGIWFDTVYGNKSRRIFLVPGPPREFEPMVRDFIVPLLRERETVSSFTGGIAICGIGESTVMMKSREVLGDFTGEIADTASEEGTRIYLTGNQQDVDEKIAKIRDLFGKSALPSGEMSLFPAFVKLLREKNLTFACAESCTGGLVATKLTDIPGVSDVFLGGIVSYSNQVKNCVLGVSSDTLSEYGAVSAECVREMVEKACAITGADCGVSLSGIAGPGGGTPEKPVGLVYAGVKTPGECRTFELHLRGSRSMIRERAAALAVNFLREMLLEK